MSNTQENDQNRGKTERVKIPEDLLRKLTACLSGLPVLEDESLQRQQDDFDRNNAKP